MFFQLPILTSKNIVWVNFSAVFFLMKDSTLSKHPWRTTCLFAMRSLMSSFSLKISCWCSSLLNSRASIWSSRWASAAFFISMTEPNYRTSCGNTVSTVYSIKGSAPDILHLKRKQWWPDSFSRVASSCGTSDRTCPFHSVFNVLKSHHIFGECMPFNCCPAIIVINIPNRSWHINGHKTLSQVWNMHKPYVFTIKLESFYNRTLNWKAHLFYFFLVKRPFVRLPDKYNFSQN